jgi:hypothetical protein
MTVGNTCILLWSKLTKQYLPPTVIKTHKTIPASYCDQNSQNNTCILLWSKLTKQYLPPTVIKTHKTILLPHNVIKTHKTIPLDLLPKYCYQISQNTYAPCVLHTCTTYLIIQISWKGIHTLQFHDIKQNTKKNARIIIKTCNA